MRILGLSEFERERRALDLNWNSQVAIVVKNPPADAGDAKDAGSIPRSGRSPGEGHGNSPIPPVFLLGESHGQRSLVGYCL